MSRAIFLSDTSIEDIVARIRDQIRNTKSHGTIEIKYDLESDEKGANIYFTSDAWTKMQSLISTFSTEIQWHGLVRRLSEQEFEIYDIIVPPHTVTGATVTSDAAEYSKWINDLDDETFNHLHFHGHSHVNMGCTPSGVDTKYREDVVTQLPRGNAEAGEDSFYIFLIFNKRGDWTGEIFDLTNNALYETNDIGIDVYSGDDGFLSDFVAQAKRMTTNHTYSTQSQPSTSKTSKKEKKNKYEKKKEPAQLESQYDYYYDSYSHYRGIYDDDDDNDPRSPFYVGRQ